jgi:hypothetical protein
MNAPRDVARPVLVELDALTGREDRRGEQYGAISASVLVRRWSSSVMTVATAMLDDVDRGARYLKAENPEGVESYCALSPA